MLHASIAQVEERHLGKMEVIGSIPIVGSNGDWYNGSTPALGAEGESSTLSSPTSFTGRGLAWCATCLGDK